MKRLTVNDAALKLGVSRRRVLQKLKQGHFPNHARCECGLCVMIPESDLLLPVSDRRKKKLT